jgi:hypothetical protein
MAKFVQTYSAVTDEAFDHLTKAFAGALRAVTPLCDNAVEYKGQKLYHPFQISLNGPPRSGKSTFVRNAVEDFLEQEPVRTGRSASSADETRAVQVWARWVTPGFEVRSEDHLAQQSLAHERNIFLPEALTPSISFFEHAQPETREHCPMTIRIFYDGKSARYLTIEASEEVAALPDFQRNFVEPARILQID